MSLINTIIASMKGRDIKRRVSEEEKEVREMFPLMHPLDAISLSVDYRMWKSVVCAKDDLCLSDYIDYLNGKQFIVDATIAENLRQKAIESLNNKLEFPDGE